MLKYFPSLLVRKRHEGDYNHAILSTRASGTGNSARSLVFADGIQLSNLLGNGVSGLSVLPRKGLVTPEEIARVDVMYGPFSAAYSGNSVGAVVDCQTRMPNKFEAHVASNFSYQPFDRYNTHSNYKAWQTSASLGSRSGAWSWWLAVNHMDSDGQPLTFANRLLSTEPAAALVTGAYRQQQRGQPGGCSVPGRSTTRAGPAKGKWPRLPDGAGQLHLRPVAKRC
ncbi:MAG: TonB-dependent receptor plug domain-containing protein [Burkholderiales bacterium]